MVLRWESFYTNHHKSLSVINSIIISIKSSDLVAHLFKCNLTA